MLERIREFLLPKGRESSVRDVRIGLGYTAVQLDSGAVGLAYTFRGGAGGCCGALDGKGSLAGRPASDLLDFLRMQNTTAVAVGLAAANALLHLPPPTCSTGDVLDCICLSAGDRVGMVGHFAPLVPRIRERCRELLVFHEEPGKAGSTPSPVRMEDLETCRVVLITATALINRTLETLFPLLKSCREAVLLGPSTPLCPEVFRDTPLSLLSGVRIRDSEAILRVVSEGGGTRRFGDAVEKVNLRV